MKMCERNKKTFYYRLYAGKVAEVDSDGFETGSSTISYGDLVTARASISPNKGKASIEMFGSDLNYDKTIITDDMDCTMNENSVVWVNNDPTKTPPEPHDYVVVAKAEGLLSISYAIRKVDVQ